MGEIERARRLLMHVGPVTIEDEVLLAGMRRHMEDRAVKVNVVNDRGNLYTHGREASLYRSDDCTQHYIELQ